MPTIFYQGLFWLYWGIAALLGGLLVWVLVAEQDKHTRALAAMLLVPVVLRLLLIK